jgi:hypothetical protein
MSKSGVEIGKGIVVFSIIRDSTCAECGRDLYKGQLLRLEREQALCLTCADLDHLAYPPRGDAALTRRAKKLSKLHAVVVRFSRAALRERAAERRASLDEGFVAKFGEKIRQLFPGCPIGKERIIAEHACRRCSGRVGRSKAAKQFDARAIKLAVRAMCIP